MIILPPQKLTLLLPWKTGSQTLRARLSGQDQSPYPQDFYFNPSLNRVVHQHIILSDYMALPEYRTGHALAVFVRNPYDRVFSGFQQFMRDLSRYPERRYPSPWVRELIMEQATDIYNSVSRSGLDINAWFQSVPAHRVLETSRNICFPLHPAHYWTHYNGKQAVQFIGRVENFEQDFSALCKQYTLTPTGTGSANQSNATLARADANGYKYAHHFAPVTIARINALFKDDFELFGYKKLPDAPAETASF